MHLRLALPIPAIALIPPVSADQWPSLTTSKRHTHLFCTTLTGTRASLMSHCKRLGWYILDTPNCLMTPLSTKVSRVCHASFVACWRAASAPNQYKNNDDLRTSRVRSGLCSTSESIYFTPRFLSEVETESTTCSVTSDSGSYGMGPARSWPSTDVNLQLLASVDHSNVSITLSPLRLNP